MVPAGESVSVIEPCRGPPAASDMPAENHFEVTKCAQRAPRLSSAYYDLGTGISKLK